MSLHTKPLIAVLLMLMFSFALPTSYMGNVVAAEVDSTLEERLVDIELRLKQARLVIKKLKHDYLLAVKSNQTMQDEGLPVEDVHRIEREFKKKVKKMIETAMNAINDV